MTVTIIATFIAAAGLLFVGLEPLFLRRDVERDMELELRGRG
jgi:hypothetical protein